MCRCNRFLSLLAILAVLLGSPQLFGQAVTATLVGIVTDNSGAALDAAKIAIVEQQTGASLSQTTNASGNYEFTFLPPGIYTVSVTKDGFAVKVIKNVHVPVNTTARVDMALDPGSVAQTITVTDQAPLLQTDRSDVSSQIESQQVENLPLASDLNFQALEALTPGVTPSFYSHSGFFDAQNSQAFQVNGQSAAADNLQFEGIDDNERTGEAQVYIPAAAAIQTVDVETSNYAAEFGRATGAVTNVTLKSGTNQYRGSLYEYNSVSSTSARSYFNNTGQFPRFTNNYYGGTFGGPVIKNHTFFFGDFLRYSNESSQYLLLTVPTAAFRAGDLSAGPTAIYDPSTGAANGTGRQQFVTNGVPNVIPASQLNPIAQKLIALVPLPNIPGAGFTNNYQNTVGSHQDTSQFDIKLDQNLRGSDHLTYRYSWQRVNITQDPVFGTVAGGPASPAGYPGRGQDTTYTTAVEYTHVFSPTFLTEARAGISHYYDTAYPNDYGTDASTQIGIPGANVSPFTSGLTSISIGGYSSPMVGYSPYLPLLHSESDIDAVNNWTKILGNHSIKFGGEVRRVRDDLTQAETYGGRGIFTYADGQTALNSAGSQTSFANDFASFLLDVPSSVGQDVNVEDGSFRQTLYFAFVQDTWQATPKLTLTYGLRWEFYPPATPKESGGFSQYDPSTNSLKVAGYGNVPKNLGLRVNNKNLEPRLGFAYRATPKSVVRGGFGVSHTPLQGSLYAYNYPVAQNISFSSLNSYTPAVNNDGQFATLAQGFPASPQPAIPANGIISNANLNSFYYVVNPDYKDPYVMSWNLTLEQNLGYQWVGNIAYVGNQGRQIPGIYNLNAGLVAGAGAMGQPEYTTFGRTASTSLLMKGTSSNYNALQARLLHRFANGLVWTSSYAWQKAMGYVSNSGTPSGFNFYLDFQRNYAHLTFNATQTYAQSVVYELPFGKDKPFLNQGWGQRLAGGWQIGSIMDIQTGIPLLFKASASQLNTPGTIQVPNQVKPFHKLSGIGTQQEWFDPSSFQQPVGAALGNMGQNVFAGPGQFSLDGSLFRTFSFRESMALRLRMDAFNALNHPNFGVPDTTLTDPNFGHVTSTTGSARTLQFSGTFSF